MKCPACNRDMTQLQVRGIQVDVCKGGCGGVWFDTYEFRKFNLPHDYAGAGLLNVERDERVEIDDSSERKCPRCKTIPMIKHFYSARRAVEIDECSGCAGVWLDAGELGKIRALFKSDEERRSVNDKAFEDAFGAELKVYAMMRKQHLLKARKFANGLKFACPSYFAPGKHDWGAF